MANLDLSPDMTGEEIVVTGISGIFPKSGSVQEFMHNLYNKVDMVSKESRWTLSNPEIPKHIGTLSGMEHFDAQFFKVGFQKAVMMEPISRKTLEHAYGAIFDSGNTHATLKGKIVGVFIGSSYSDFSTCFMFDVSKGSDSIVSGTSKSMIANRISYWMDGKGPSYCVDYSCVSTAAALEQAVTFIENGTCDAAVVGGGNLCSHPSLSLNIKKAGMLCLDGKTKCFDENGDGFVRSEAINVIFLQKAKDAKRIYAEVVHVDGAFQLKGNDRFLPVRKPEELEKFFNDVYSKTKVDPKDVEYVEASAVALAEADGNEAEAIGNVFYNNKPVKVGSVKSNMGHSEPVSALCSLTKLCLSYLRGEIPANLHLEKPIKAAKDGKVQILTENTKFNRGYTAINNLSFTGAGFHVILKGHYKEKNLQKYECNIPRIVCASGRQDLSVKLILNELKSKKIDAEEIGLLHSIFEKDIVGHTGRGFAIFDTVKNGTVTIAEDVNHYPGTRPPLWFVFSGMGSQWIGMGRDLMKIPIFSSAIERCQKVLESKGIDLLEIIAGSDKSILDNVLNPFLGIGAVQIGLIDILKEMGVEPDYIIGHSLGETACAYHDNTFNTEQTILSMYNRAIATQGLNLIKGSMAAVGMGYKSLVKECPPEIDIACRNSDESSTISGPADVMKEFIADLTKRGIFARAVPSSNIAFHSRYIKEVGPKLQKSLEEIITDPKPRSQKWISTSVPKEKWDDPAAKYSSAEYQKNNILNPVLFEDVLKMIPDNAVVVEIAPHGLLQAILKRALKNCTHIPLTKRGCPDGIKFLLEAIGKLYTCGFNPKVDVLYPKIKFPVSTETPLLSHLVHWEHSEQWPMVSFRQNTKITATSRNIVFSLQDEDYKYINGYSRNGVNVVPEAALLAFVWETLAMYQGTDFRTLSVMFKDIQFHSEVVVTAESLVRLNVMISKGKNTFEVTHEDKLVISGSVIETNHLKIRETNHNETSDEFEPEINLSDQDIYRILRMRGYTYRNTFRSIASSNLNRTKALIKWTGDWIPFLDSLIQLNTVSRDYNGISKPKFIRVLKISVTEQERRNYEIINGFKCYDASVDNVYGKTSCAGVQIEDIKYTNAPMSENKVDILESKIFFPYYPTDVVNVNTAFEMSLQIVTENSSSKNMLITKVVTNTALKEFDVIDEVVKKTNLSNVEIKTVNELNKESFNVLMNGKSKVNVVVMDNLLQDSKKLLELHNSPDETFILSIEDNVPKMQSVKHLFSILSSMSDGKRIFILMKKIKTNSNVDTCFIPIKFDDTFSWVPDVYSKLVTTKRVVLVSERQPYCGVLGFVKNLKTSGQTNISVVIIDDFNAPKFDPNNDFYKQQLQQNLTLNVMRKGQWGSYYYKSTKMSQKLKSFALKNLTPGNLENIVWVEAPKISGEKKLAQVCYSGLSINDCHKMMDDAKNKNESSLLGMDFSGIDANGDKVMGLIPGGSASSSIEVDPDLVWSVPDHWSLEDAATIPLAYIQAYYCLTIRCQLQKGDTVLICDGTSSVGLAAISICLSYNCTVFTVVDTEEKKKYLIECYPDVGENNIICSDSDNFFNMLMIIHKKPNFRFVLSFASGPLRQAAMKCVGDSGFLIDFSKHDAYNNEHLGMWYLARERSYLSINILNIFRPEYSEDRKILQKFIAQGIENGVVKPLKRAVYSPAQVTKAFEVLSQNKYIGNILLRVRDPNMSDGLETIPRLSYSPHDVTIIVCDEKGIGIELADKLVERGARKIALHMKSVSGYVHTKLITWNKQEVSVKLSSENLQTEKGSTSFMKNALKFGKVRAVFIVFDPKHTDNGIKKDFISVFKKQSVVFMNLDVASRNCGDLSQFTVISPSPQNPSGEYSLSLIERMCDARNEIGLKTLVVRYKSLEEMDDEPIDNAKPQQLTAFFSAIEASIQLKHTNVLTYNTENTKELSNDTEKDGLNAFYELVDTENDNMESQPIVDLPTLFSSENCDTYLDHQSDAYIILMPGFDGRSQIFESAAERLKLRALSVQLGPDLEGKCIKYIAKNIREEIRQKTNDDEVEEDGEDENKKEQRRIVREKRNKRFYIMGYSFGVNIAMELAALLEKEGKTGVVHCLDSSPDKLRETIDNLVGQGTEDQLQNLILNHMYNLLTGEKCTEHLNLENKTFEQKLDEYLKQMKGVVNYSEQYKRMVVESAYKRIIMARQYKPEFKLRSQIILMKNSKTDSSDDYGLSKYTTSTVKVFKLHAHNSKTVLKDIRVSNIINMFLDEDVLTEFKNKNLCDVYFTRAQF